MNKYKSLIVVLILILSISSIFALESTDITFKKTGKDVIFTVNDDICLKAVADSINMPVKKLKFMLSAELAKYGEIHTDYKGLKTQSRRWDNIPLKDLKIEPKTISDKFIAFTANTLNFGYSVTIVGILVVFFSLVLISILIAQFQHIDRAKAPKRTKKESKSKTTVKTSVGNVTGPSDAISSNAIVAVIAALHKHKMTVEERRRIQMTFCRTSVNMWGASNKMSMPNLAYKKPERKN